MKGFVNGFGASGSMDWDGSRVACWTNKNGPNMFKECESECMKSQPPKNPICEDFFKSDVGRYEAETGENDDGVRVYSNGKLNECFYQNQGPGEFGWCQVFEQSNLR